MKRSREPSDDNKNRKKFKESEKGLQKFVQNGENRNQALENDELFDISSYQPREFDVTKVSPDSFVVVVGKRRYGKSWWSQWLLSFIFYMFREVYVFTGTKHNGFWDAHVPEKRIYQKFQPDIIDAILDQQRAIYERFLEGYDDGTVPHVLVILDDVIDDASFKHQETLHRLAYAGRHYFMFVLLCTQDCKGIGPGLRGNADLIVLTYQTAKRNIESFAEDYCTFIDKRQFTSFIQKQTQNHEMLVIDQTEAKYNVQDIFWKSSADEEPPEPYRIGTLDFWMQSGCIWEDQVTRSGRTPKFKQKEWVARAQAFQGLEKEREEEIIRSYYQRFVTNQPGLAPKPVQDALAKEIEREIGESNCMAGAKMVSKLFQYNPGPVVKKW